MTTTATGTATAAKIFLALTILQSPTVNQILDKLDQPSGRAQKTTTLWQSSNNESNSRSAATIQTSSVAAISKVTQVDEADRPTTSREKLIGELRRWGLLATNWDGEGAASPVASSLKEAVSFVRLLDDVELPEPMLHASGHAGLFWKDDSLYADIEFLGDGRIAYYIERHGDKHKGVLSFDSKKMPAVFPALLRA